MATTVEHQDQATADVDRADSSYRDVTSRLKILVMRWPLGFRLVKRGYGAARFWLRQPHEEDFALFANLNHRPGLFVDIGANTGQSARSFRIFNRSFRIVSFEPNRLLEADLRFTRKLIGSDFRYMLYGCGQKTSTAQLFVPVVGETPLSPWASLDPAVIEENRLQIEREIGTTFTIREVPVEIKRFDDFDLAPDVVKIDVEGLELSVLEGMEGTLRRHQPLLMIESNASEQPVMQFLAQRGYRFFGFDRRRNLLQEGPGDEAKNYFALSSRRLEELRQLGRPALIEAE